MTGKRLWEIVVGEVSEWMKKWGETEEHENRSEPYWRCSLLSLPFTKRKWICQKSQDAIGDGEVCLDDSCLSLHITTLTCLPLYIKAWKWMQFNLTFFQRGADFYLLSALVYGDVVNCVVLTGVFLKCIPSSLIWNGPKSFILVYLINWWAQGGLMLLIVY